ERAAGGTPTRWALTCMCSNTTTPSNSARRCGDWRVPMRYETTTRLKPKQALALARLFFGRELGLTEQVQSSTTAAFAGSDGDLTIEVYATDGDTTVEVVAREWDYQAREYLRLLKEQH